MRQIARKLFYAPGACSLAPHIVLEWIGQPDELQKVKLGDPEYTKINPLGQVPAMIDDTSEVMTQASAILEYLAHKYPDAKLGDDGTSQGGFSVEHWLALPEMSTQRFIPFLCQSAMEQIITRVFLIQ